MGKDELRPGELLQLKTDLLRLKGMSPVEDRILINYTLMVVDKYLTNKSTKEANICQ